MSRQPTLFFAITISAGASFLLVLAGASLLKKVPLYVHTLVRHTTYRIDTWSPIRISENIDMMA